MADLAKKMNEIRCLNNYIHLSSTLIGLDSIIPCSMPFNFFSLSAFSLWILFFSWIFLSLMITLPNCGWYYVCNKSPPADIVKPEEFLPLSFIQLCCYVLHCILDSWNDHWMEHNNNGTKTRAHSLHAPGIWQCSICSHTILTTWPLPTLYKYNVHVHWFQIWACTAE